MALNQHLTLALALALTLAIALTPILALSQVALKQHLRGETIPCTRDDDPHGEFAGVHRLLSPRQVREMSRVCEP